MKHKVLKKKSYSMGPLIISIRQEGFGISADIFGTMAGHSASLDCLHEKMQHDLKLLLLSTVGGSVEQHSQQFKV